jgi:Ca2+-binding RTX toxin-like protein
MTSIAANQGLDMSYSRSYSLTSENWAVLGYWGEIWWWQGVTTYLTIDQAGVSTGYFSLTAPVTAFTQWSSTTDWALSVSGVNIPLAVLQWGDFYTGFSAQLNVEWSSILTGNDSIYGSQGTDVLHGYGGDDEIIGNGGNDTLYGGDANDRLYGNEGDDGLNGNYGKDYLAGGSGNDTLDGGLGVDSADYSDKTLSVVVTLNGASNATVTVGGVAEDTIRNIEGLIGGKVGDQFTGDALANKFNGNAGKDILSGNGGDDTLIGRAGIDALLGGEGNDTLIGDKGNDKLTGGIGADTFRFDTALHPLKNVDTVKDFLSIDDVFQLENNIFTELTTTGTLSADSFRASTDGTAGDSNDYILYNTTTGGLYYDADGSGAGLAIQFATLTGAPTINNLDFVVIW